MILPQDELKRRMEKHLLPVVYKQSNAKTFFRVPEDLLPPWHTREITVVYDKRRHSFVTVLFNDGGLFYDTNDSD